MKAENLVNKEKLCDWLNAFVFEQRPEGDMVSVEDVERGIEKCTLPPAELLAEFRSKVRVAYALGGGDDHFILRVPNEVNANLRLSQPVHVLILSQEVQEEVKP